MTMEQTAYFLAGSILLMMGFIVIAIGVVTINNIFAEYWKPVKFFLYSNYADTHRFQQEPLSEETKK